MSEWIYTIIASLIVAAIVAVIVSHRERRKGDRRMYRDTEAWIARNADDPRPVGFTHAGFGNDETPSP